METTQYVLPQWARYCADQGWPVFPLRPWSKRPALHGHRTCPGTGRCSAGHRGWQHRATTDPHVIDRCWAHDHYNIGLATEPAQLLVIDLDQPEPGEHPPPHWADATTGWDVLATLANRAGASIPDTYTVRTPNDGWHLYLQAPPDQRVRSSASQLGWHIDIRAAGGYVVAPGSHTPGGGYELIDDTPPAPCPPWLLDHLHNAEDRPTRAESHPPGTALTITAHSRTGYLQAVLRGEYRRVASARPGEQNLRLFQAAATLGAWVAGGALDTDTARRSLHQAMAHVPNSRPEHPWKPHDIDRAIDSGLHTGATHPRRLTSDEPWSAAA